MIEELLTRTRADTASVTGLAAALIRQPSRGGLDPYAPVFAVLEKFLADRDLPHRRLHDADEALVGLVCEIAGAHPGPLWVLDACIDTAPFGDEHAWSFAPAAGEVVDGWLRGRGSSDSKIAASMFCHIAAAVAEQREHLHGTLAVLLDADEHTGGFGGAKAYFGSGAGQHAAGVMIGYPGLEEVVVGGRGSWRALVHVYGAAGHSGSSTSPDPACNAVVRTARLVQFLSATGLPPAADGGFPLPGKLTITQIRGGEGFSTVPDHAVVGVDARLTDVFDAAAAEKLLTEAATDLDTTWPAPRPTTVENVTNWPPFHLADSDQPAAALLSAAAAAGLQVRPKVAGPSNIGNYLAGLGIPATAGFGLPYEGLHGIDERVRLEQLPTVQAVYHQAILSLLTLPAGEV